MPQFSYATQLTHTFKERTVRQSLSVFVFSLRTHTHTNEGCKLTSCKMNLLQDHVEKQQGEGCKPFYGVTCVLHARSVYEMKKRSINH